MLGRIGRAVRCGDAIIAVHGAALEDPLIDAPRAAWDESGWIELVDTDPRGPDD